MADVQLLEPYAGFSGKMTKDSETILRTRNGRTHAYKIKHPNLRPRSEAQKTHTSLFGQISAQVRADMRDPERLAQWEEKYARYRHEHKAELDALKTANSNDLKRYSSRRKRVITGINTFIFHELYEQALHEQH